jgi:transcription-repair coupling factor (superfamily II helicase)
VRFERIPPRDGLAPAPSFAAEPRPFAALAEFLRAECAEGRRTVLAAASGRDLRALLRRVRQELGTAATQVGSWREIRQARPGSLLALSGDLDRGFASAELGVAVVTSVDVLGSRARTATVGRTNGHEVAGTEIEFRFGDAVIHREHGLGRLEGSERIETNGVVTDLLRLAYADDARLMVPMDEMGDVWRYGESHEGLSLDRLDGSAWEKRRAAVEAEIAETATRLVALMQERSRATAPRLVPPPSRYERFVAGFPFSETADQTAAIEDVLGDLASGRPMNRLVCGDVGFGKTEVALRAAAAAALSGMQVALAAPTTVLVRQHVETFTHRFAALGIRVAHLSRLTKPAEARAVKQGLADGTVRIVIGTHALAGKGVRFKDLGLLIVDEEQRFGSAHKAPLRAFGKGVHLLSQTATPIPRTLQSALVGLQDMSVIATPPARRQPIRTFLAPFDEATVRDALMREKLRGGQSFVVCPRIEDIEPLASRLAALVPELETVVAHGKMPAEAIDHAMVRFADGEGDVLLATNIIESGLDVPRANTMLIWRPDRFGLAQLHQLRGRVGRGRLRGVAYLLTDPAHRIVRSTRKRLETLESLDWLGAGFAISARDLDQRGAGDLFGEEQAGHMRLIGVGLYQDMLRRALAEARGEPPVEAWMPEINAGSQGFIPEDYVPEPEVRINLYARVAKLASDEEIEALEDEIEDRFGPLPDPVTQLVELARLRGQCRAARVARLDAGPQAVAATLRDESRDLLDAVCERSDGALVEKGGRLVWARSASGPEQLRENAAKMLRFVEKAIREKQPRT